MRLGVLASGGGTNVEAILQAIESGRLKAKVCVVISNNSKAGVMERAGKRSIPTCHVSSLTHSDPDRAIVEALQSHSVNFVCLCGYMKPLGMETIRAFPGRVVNIHPALLPKFGGKGMYGMNVHEAVVAAKETESGPTLHVVVGEYDKGPILAQEKVAILPTDTPQDVAQKVLEKEHILYWQTLDKIQRGEITLPSIDVE